eukprot:gene3896-8392_t
MIAWTYILRLEFGIVLLVAQTVTEKANAEAIDTLRHAVNRLIAESIPPKKHAIFVDTSLFTNSHQSQYYLDRDGPAWKLAFARFNYTIAIEHAGTPRNKRHLAASKWSVLLCLGLRRQDEACLAPSSHKLLTTQQFINQINGMRDILWKKHEMCRTIQGFGLSSNDMQFVFPCFVLPKDEAKLRSHTLERNQPWIVKPLSRGEGRGIFIADSLKDIVGSANSSFRQYYHSGGAIVQPLLTNPMLIDGFKFDLRLYVLVTSITPLSCYIFTEGLVRLAAEKYSKDVRKARPSQFLTNTSIGKRFRPLEELNWTLKRLKEWCVEGMDTSGMDYNTIYGRIKKAVVKVLILSEPRFHKHFANHMSGSTCSGCFQLLGVDVILTATGQPRVIEVNGLPSMQLMHEQGEEIVFTNDYAARKIVLTNEIVEFISTRPNVTETVINFFKQFAIGVAPTLCEPSVHRMCIEKPDLFLIIRWFSARRILTSFDELMPEAEPDLLYQSHRIIQQELYHRHGNRVAFTYATTTYRLLPLLNAFRKFLS